MTAPIRTTLLAAAAAIVLVVAFWIPVKSVDAQEITVYKSPACGCCSKWVDHLRDHGFTVKTHELDDLNQIKAEHGISPEIASCHTALIEGYVVEGHVPADVIKRLLAERPEVIGISVPGMPMGSPGMEGPYSERYHILTFDAQGNTAVYASR